MIAGLLGLLAHDLRNPLSALQSNVGYLGSLPGVETSDVAEALEDAELSCEELAVLIESIETFSLLLHPPKSVALRRVDAKAVVLEAVQRAQSLARSHEVTIVVSPELQRLETGIVTDQAFAFKAVTGILRNAVQHSPSGKSVSVSARLNGSRLTIVIEDEGPALDAKLRERAFSPQGQLELKGKRGGRYSRGLGLLCAGLTASLADLEVRAKQTRSGNVFELLAALAD